MTNLLEIRNLTVEFRTRAGTVHAVNGVDLDVAPGEILGLVGESGCGKTVSVLSILRLLPARARVVAGEVKFAGRDLLVLSKRELRAIRGREIGTIFQDPLTSLHPSARIGNQVGEALRAHDRRLSRSAARSRAIDLLADVGVPNPSERARQYPHEWSGGMRQRSMIAMAIANRPRLLIADEPTSALDAITQAQVVEVIRTAQRETGAATILVSHDLGLLAQLADRVAVMYGGRVVETADVDTLFAFPKHPYTVGLLTSLRALAKSGERLVPIGGHPPVLMDVPTGCTFEPRCWLGSGRDACRLDSPQLVAVGQNGHQCACHFSESVGPQPRPPDRC